MASSATFLQCMPCGTSFSCIFYSSCIIVFRDSDTSLSSMCFLGIIPDRCSLNTIAMYARVSSLSLRLFLASTSIVFLYISTITMMYVLLVVSVLVTALSGRIRHCSLLCTRLCICHVPCALGVWLFWALLGECFRFDGPVIFSLLVQVAFWRLVGIWVISGDVAFGQHLPSYSVTRFYEFYPRGLDWISAYCMHPFDSLFFGRQVVYAMC